VKELMEKTSHVLDKSDSSFNAMRTNAENAGGTPLTLHALCTVTGNNY
jgi:hypothetical protein